jgi:hypothetical protein
MFRNGPYLNISYYGPDLITLHTVDFGVSVTFAVFLNGSGSPSVFKLLSILKINFFLGRYLEGPKKSNNPLVNKRVKKTSSYKGSELAEATEIK